VCLSEAVIVIDNNKHTSLLGTELTTVVKSFIKWSPKACTIKLFSAIIDSCHGKLECLSETVIVTENNEHTNLLHTALITVVKSFVIQTPRACVIKLFTAVINSVA
jgi:hypothetical protein